MSRRAFLLLATSIVVLSSWPAGAAATKHVSIRTGQSEFTPQTVHIHAGDSVTWTNDDSGFSLFYRGHTVTADDGSFDSGTINKQQSFTFRFTSQGEFSYHCAIHTNMTGTVVVAPRANHTQPPTTTPTATARTSPKASPSKSSKPSSSASSPRSPTPSIEASGVSSNATSAGAIISIAIVSIAALIGLGYFVYLRLVRDR